MRPGLLFLLCVAVWGCRENRANDVRPSLRAPAEVDLGFAKVGATETRVVVLEAATATAVDVTSVRIEGTTEITVASAPQQVKSLGEASLRLTFSPTEEGEVSGTLVIKSNDADRPEQRIPVHGRGALPTLAASWRCDNACSAAISGNAVTFPPEPSARLRPIDVSGLPRLSLRATGDVDVLLSTLTLSGPGFSFVGNAKLPTGGLRIAAGTEQSVAVVFQPSDTVNLQFNGTIDLTSDATDTPSAHFTMNGSVRDNLPPTACAGLLRVTPAGGTPRDVAFNSTELVMPRSEVTLTPFSAPQDTVCSFDPDDGRAGLSFLWAITSQPAGSNVTLADATSPNPRFRPVVSGAYELSLALQDAQGHIANASVTVQVGVSANLVTELSWPGFTGVDLDLHMVKPGASPFTPQSDLSGLSLLAGHNSYDWGTPGSVGDPWMLFDSTGDDALVETISIEHPDCGAGACTFGLYVQGFRDTRPVGTTQACTLTPACRDGDACSCPAAHACVADLAPADGGVSSTGRCLPSTSATLRIFVRGATSPTTSISVTVGAPCQLVRVADVTWPAATSDAGVIITAASGSERYGQRESGSLQCAPPYVLLPR